MESVSPRLRPTHWPPSSKQKGPPHPAADCLRATTAGPQQAEGPTPPSCSLPARHHCCGGSISISGSGRPAIECCVARLSAGRGSGRRSIGQHAHTGIYAMR